MAITAPVAGAYVTTLTPAKAGGGATPLGYTKSGFNLNFTTKAEKLEETDLFGLCLIDMVYRGCQMTIDTICRIFQAVTRDALFPWTGTFGRVYSVAAPIAMLASSQADVLLMTAVAGTSAAAAAGLATFTAPFVKLSPDNNLALILSSVLRDVPLRWDVILTESAGISPQTGTLFTST